jgi:hypothetical protein
MRYCDDADCPNFHPVVGEDINCRLGFRNPLRPPASMEKAVKADWGYVMPRACRRKYRRHFSRNKSG